MTAILQYYKDMSRTSFTEQCPKCYTIFRVDEIGEKYPAKCYDPIYCPVCNEIVKHKNTLYFFDEKVESLENTIEPFKSEYLSKNNE